MFCSSGMGLAQSSNYTCGSKGLPRLPACQELLFCYVTGDKIIPFSARECQRHTKGAAGAAAAPAGMNVRIRDRAARATAMAMATAAGCPRRDPRATGAGAPQKAGVPDTAAKLNPRKRRTERLPLLTHRLPHPPPRTRACVHSFGPWLPVSRRRRPGPRICRGAGGAGRRSSSRGAHLIPSHSFWGFSAPGRFITFSGDG